METRRALSIMLMAFPASTRITSIRNLVFRSRSPCPSTMRRMNSTSSKKKAAEPKEIRISA